MTGFYLTARKDIAASEEKIYGSHSRRVDKVMRSYMTSNRNFGAILSGQKGIGKSVFAKLLAAESIKLGFPVLTVSNYIPGIAGFLSSIEQEVVVLFDEFEKTFGETDDYDPQEEMLTLFDGFDNGCKLFIITCNDVSKLNDCLLNRPGRFHYHFCLENPTDNEIREYLQDNLSKQYWDVIDRIINFAYTIDITYDYLRAIVFELNHGYTLEETLNELNIPHSSSSLFDVTLYLEDNREFTSFGDKIDLYSKNMNGLWMHNGDERFYVKFYPNDIHVENGYLVLTADKIILNRDTEDDWDANEAEIEANKAAFKSIKPKRMIFEKLSAYGMKRYTV